MIYFTLSQASRKAFLFPANARQSVYASGACDKELETNRLSGFCVEATMDSNRREYNREYFKEYYKRFREKLLERSKVYGKEHREERLVIERRWRENNRERDRELKRKWEAENHEHMIDKKRNRRAAEKAGGRITFAQWKAILDKYGNKCINPDCPNPIGVDLQMDHVIPLKLGGTHTIDNIQPLCKSFNCRKSAKHIDYRR